MSLKRNVANDSITSDLAEKEKSTKKQKCPAGNSSRQQRHRDLHGHTEEYRNRRHMRYMKSKIKLKSDENCLLFKHCIDSRNNDLISTPVGLIRYNQPKSHFKLQLESDCTALNVKGSGSYGLVVQKGNYCYKISVATQNGNNEMGDKVNMCCVKKLNDAVDENRVKSIRISKACAISFEKDSLKEISKIAHLRHCTASYIGKSTYIISRLI
jgi:hypothetical protein